MKKKSEIILIKEDKKKEINNNYDKDKKVNTMENKQFNNFSKNEEKGFEFNLDEKFFEDGLDEDKILQYLQLKSQSVEINNNVNKSENQKNNNKTNELWGASASSGSSSEESDPEENFESENLQKKILEEKKFLLEKGNQADLNFDLDKDRKDEMQKIKQEIQIIKKRLKNKNEGIEDEDLDDKPILTPLQEMRMKYLKNKRPRNNKEKAEKLNEFVINLKNLSKQEGNWMSNKLKFHTDSQKAFDISDTKEKVMRNFDFNK